MLPQYLAERSVVPLNCEAFEPQNDLCAHDRYCPAKVWAMLGVDCTQAIGTSERGRTGPKAHVGSVECDRRIRCPRASKCLQCLVCLVSPRATSRKKSSLSSIRSRSRPSPSTPASTSKTVGRASRPAHPQALRSHGPLDRDHGLSSQECRSSKPWAAASAAPLTQTGSREYHQMSETFRSVQWCRTPQAVRSPRRGHASHGLTSAISRGKRTRSSVAPRYGSEPTLSAAWLAACRDICAIPSPRRLAAPVTTAAPGPRTITRNRTGATFGPARAPADPGTRPFGACRIGGQGGIVGQALARRLRLTRTPC